MTILAELDRGEMLEALGGEQISIINIGHDLGYLLGYTVGTVQRWFEEMPSASYAYAKVGYTS